MRDVKYVQVDVIIIRQTLSHQVFSLKVVNGYH